MNICITPLHIGNDCQFPPWKFPCILKWLISLERLWFQENHRFGVIFINIKQRQCDFSPPKIRGQEDIIKIKVIEKKKHCLDERTVVACHRSVTNSLEHRWLLIKPRAINFSPLLLFLNQQGVDAWPSFCYTFIAWRRRESPLFTESQR